MKNRITHGELRTFFSPDEVIGSIKQCDAVVRRLVIRMR
jgi:hypothetical protein